MDSKRKSIFQTATDAQIGKKINPSKMQDQYKSNMYEMAKYLEDEIIGKNQKLQEMIADKESREGTVLLILLNALKHVANSNLYDGYFENCSLLELDSLIINEYFDFLQKHITDKETMSKLRELEEGIFLHMRDKYDIFKLSNCMLSTVSDIHKQLDEVVKTLKTIDTDQSSGINRLIKEIENMQTVLFQMTGYYGDDFPNIHADGFFDQHGYSSLTPSQQEMFRQLPKQRDDWINTLDKIAWECRFKNDLKEPLNNATNTLNKVKNLINILQNADYKAADDKQRLTNMKFTANELEPYKHRFKDLSPKEVTQPHTVRKH